MKLPALLLLALSPLVPGVTIKIDYSLDSNNFFNTQARKDAIEAVARFYGDLITDKLLRIDAAQFDSASWTASPFHPATGVLVDIPDLVVPEDTIIVYVGSRVLAGNTTGVGGPGGWGGSGHPPWFDRIEGRGNAGALGATPTDHAPWGGSITFDSDRTWNFSLTTNLSGTEFVHTALHEMGHVLGIGTASSWMNKVSGSVFTGAASTRSYGTTPPVQSGGGHFGGSSLTSPSFGSFGRAHGTAGPVVMFPSITDSGSVFSVITDLDLAGLIDCGWEIRPPLELGVASLAPAGASFTWKSSSFLDYRIERGNTPLSFPDGGLPVAGNGSIRTWSDPAPPPAQAFYRLRATRPAVAAVPAAQPPAIRADEGFTTRSEPPRFATGCAAGNP